jgi:hypothetical protein
MQKGQQQCSACDGNCTLTLLPKSDAPNGYDAHICQCPAQYIEWHIIVPAVAGALLVLLCGVFGCCIICDKGTTGEPATATHSQRGTPYFTNPLARFPISQKPRKWSVWNTPSTSPEDKIASLELSKFDENDKAFDTTSIVVSQPQQLPSANPESLSAAVKMTV